jgi:hypothetical protein
MKININDTAKVKLTPKGKLLCAINAEPIMKDGAIELPLWALMRIFGPHIHMGMTEMFFVDNEIEITENV